MLKRKIERYLANWKRTPNKKPLVIKGIRQCGKTYIVQKFGREGDKCEVGEKTSGTMLWHYIDTHGNYLKEYPISYY